LGKNIIKFFRIVEGALRPALQTVRKDQANFISHCWLPDDLLLLGTEAGEILCVENNEYKGAIYPTGQERDEDVTPVFCFVGASRGFIVGTVDGELRMFERKTDSRDQWEVVRKFHVPAPDGAPSQSLGKIRALALGPDDYLAVATDMQQLFHTNISVLFQPPHGWEKDKSFTPFESVIAPFHGPNVRGDATIMAIDVALWKPIIATCGKDRTVRIWNAADRKIEAVHEFDEEPTSISLHPSGLYIAVGFLEKVQIIALLLDGFNLCREVSARACNLVKFSKGGQLFAVCAGTVVQIFHTHTGSLVSTLRGHTNKVKCLTWLDLDSRCITVGGEGAVFYWDIFPTPVRNAEKQHVNIVPFNAGCGPGDGSRAFISTAERSVRELYFSKTIDPATGAELPLKEPRDVDTGRNLGCMAYDETRGMVIAGTCEEDVPGCVLSMLTLPEIRSLSIESTTLHSGPVTAVCLSVDGSRVYTADVNGCLVISEYEGGSSGSKGSTKPSGGAARGGQESGLVSFDFVDEVAIRKATLDSKKALIKDLTHRVEELTLNNEHQLRLKELEHKDKMNEIALKFGQMLTEEHDKYDAMLNSKTEMIDTNSHFADDLEKKQANELKGIENKYRLKKNAEETRHKALLGEVEETHARWNAENLALVTSHQAYIKELCNDFEEQLAEEQQRQAVALKEKEERYTAGTIYQSHVDHDADLEASEINNKFDLRLRQEDAVGKELMAQHALIRKQLQLLVKDGDLQREEIKRMRDRESRLQDTMRSLEKDINSHKKEIREREETITEKEKRIFDLKKKNQVGRTVPSTISSSLHLFVIDASPHLAPAPAPSLHTQELEKFRFVLDYKIRELKLQIAPREAETAALRRQSEEMALELEQYHKSGQALELMLAELRLKSEGLRKELVSQEERCAANAKLIEKFKRDLRATWTVREDASSFKASVVKLYRVFVQEDVAGSSAGGSGSGGDASDPQEIYNRDREQLEKSLEALRRALKGDALAHRRDMGKMMREGVLLTGELNTLRKDARQLILQRKAIDDAGGIGPKTNLNELMGLLGLETKKKKKPADASGGAALPTPPGLKGTGARSAALRNTAATPSGAALLLAGEPKKGDQWTAWREVQLQTQLMAELEERLQSVCYSLSVDPVSVLVSIDTKLAQQ
jgi:WD40 repeat protein